MNIDEKLFDKIAHLARLHFSEEEKREMMKDMSRILSWVEKLEELETEEVEPLISMSHEINALREDKAQTNLSKEEVLKNAPKTDGDYFLVPKVIKNAK